MTNSAKTVVWSADYKPFGETTVIISTITNNLRFPGQYYDAETGLNYNYYRDYNHNIGRYIQADPIGIDEGKNNIFVYVGNSPVNRQDPRGLDGFEGLEPFPNTPTGLCIKCKSSFTKCLFGMPSPNVANACAQCLTTLALTKDPRTLRSPACGTCFGGLALAKLKCFTDNCSLSIPDCHGNCN